MVFKPCPVCNSSSPEFAAYDDVHLYACKNCSHSFTDAAGLVDVETYQPEYYTQDHKNWFSNPNLELFERIARFIDRVCPEGGSVIDIGCGKGDLLRYLADVNPLLRLTGIDLSPNEDVAGIHFLVGDSMEFEFQESYDIVINLAVIEHIENVKYFAKIMEHITKPGGYVIIMTVNVHSVLYATTIAMYRLGMPLALRSCYGRHHLNHFSVKSLNRLLSEAGLRHVKTDWHNIQMASVDYPPMPRWKAVIMKLGVRGVFVLGSLLSREFLQTTYFQRKAL